MSSSAGEPLRRARRWISCRRRRSAAVTAAVLVGILVGCGPRPDTAVVHLTRPPEPPASSEPEPEPEATQPSPAARPAPPLGGEGELNRSDVDFARAKALFEEGAQAYANGDFPRACRAFQDAYDLVPERALLFNIASCELRLGDTVSACGHFRQYVAEGDPSDPRVQQVQGQVASRCRGVP